MPPLEAPSEPGKLGGRDVQARRAVGLRDWNGILSSVEELVLVCREGVRDCLRVLGMLMSWKRTQSVHGDMHSAEVCCARVFVPYCQDTSCTPPWPVAKVPAWSVGANEEQPGSRDFSLLISHN